MRRRTFVKAALAAISVALSAASLGLREALAGICSKVKSPPRTIKLPPLPKWNKMTDDIDSADFARRSQDYERSLLPPDLVFPHPGQIWEAVRDCEVNFIARSTKLFLPGGQARIQQGERVRILSPVDPKPIWVSFQPVRYQELQESIVPETVRNCQGYQHYLLSLRTAHTVCSWPEGTGYFHELFKLVEDVV